MINLRKTHRTLTDGSKVYAVKFETEHRDATENTVTIECNSEVAADKVLAVLADHVAYAETDATT